MKLVILILSAYFCLSIQAAGNPLKHENDGCPDNSLCSKETGLYRTKWLETIKLLRENKISESFANNEIKKSNGIPINIWTNDSELAKSEKIILWDSPCKQHKAPNQKYFIGEFFTHKITNNLKEKMPKIIMANIIIKEKNELKVLSVPRGDAPIMIDQNSFYYTKDDDGIFYGLNLDMSGNLSISKTKKVTNFPKEIECTKEMSDLFIRNSPSLNFYSGHFCKDIWNNDTKSYSTILVGWSCN